MTTFKCDSYGCPNPGFIDVKWMGKVQWVGTLCKECSDGLWSKYSGLVTTGKADVQFGQPGTLNVNAKGISSVEKNNV